MSMPQLTFGQHGLGVLCNFAYVYSMSSNLQCLGDYQKLLAIDDDGHHQTISGHRGQNHPTRYLLRACLLPSIQPVDIFPVWWHGSGHLERRPFWGHHNFLLSPRDACKRFDDPFGFARGRARRRRKNCRQVPEPVCMYVCTYPLGRLGHVMHKLFVATDKVQLQV